MSLLERLSTLQLGHAEPPFPPLLLPPHTAILPPVLGSKLLVSAQKSKVVEAAGEATIQYWFPANSGTVPTANTVCTTVEVPTDGEKAVSPVHVSIVAPGTPPES